MSAQFENILELALVNEDLLRKWSTDRPTYNQRSYDDLIKAIEAGNVKTKKWTREDWEKGGYGRQGQKDYEIGGFYQDDTINYPVGNEASIPHELLHYFGGHTPGGGYGVPEIDPYNKADVALGGWLPSLHPAGRSPTLPGNNPLSDWWNQNYATQDTEYSNEQGYHPWYDEHAYDTTADLMKKNLLNYISGQQFKGPFIDPKTGESRLAPITPTKPITKPASPPAKPKWQFPWFKPKPKPVNTTEKPLRYDQNMYPIYQKQSQKAQSFRDAFSSARESGSNIFEWDGREYTTELA